MSGLESIVTKGVFFSGLASGMSCNHNGQDTNTNDTGVIDTGEPYECQPAQITSELTATAYVDEEFSYTITAERDSHSSCDVENYYSICDFPNPPVAISDDSGVNGCTMTWTPSQFDYQETFLFNLKAKDTFGIDEDVLEVYVDRVDNAPVIETTELSDAVVNTAYTAIIEAQDDDGDSLTYLLTTAPSWLSIDSLTGELSGTPSDSGTTTVDVLVSDSELNDTASYSLVVSEQPTVNVLVTVQTPDTKEAILGAYVSLDCENGEFIDGIVDSDGTLTADLTDETTCTVYAEAGSDYAVYNWDHSFVSGGEDEVSSRYHEVWAEIYYNDPTIYDPDTTSEDCFLGYIETMRDLLMYGNSMLHKILGDSGRRDFERYSEGELTDTIKYFVSDIDDEGEVVSAYVYNNMYDAVVEGVERINDENDLGFTFFEEAGIIDDASILFYWGDQSHVGCNRNADDVVETYSTGRYCGVELGTASYRTVMEETANTLFTDLDYCGESITRGGETFSATDWALWNTIHFAKYQNLMERTQDF